MARGDAGLSLRIGSLFSGVGGMDLGLADLGETAWQCEYEAFPQAVLRARFPGVVQLGDVTKLEEPPPCDLLIGGPPCQAASVAGKRLGEADDRWMWGHALRVLKMAPSPRPLYALWENPTGLLSLDKGKAFGKILDDHEDAGYSRVAWVRLFASDVGAPHRRARVFVLVVRDGLEFNPPSGPFIVPGDPLQTWVNHVMLALCGRRVGASWQEAGWPSSGVTMPGGGVWQLPDLADLVGDRTMAGWPTPTAALGDKNVRTATGASNEDARGHGGDLGTAVLWPTPTRHDGSGSGSGSRVGNPNTKAHPGTSLVDATQRALWSTPSCSDANGGGDHGEGGPDLRTQVSLWATPCGMDARGVHHKPSKGGRNLNRDVESQWPTPSATPYGSSQNGCPGDGRECYAGKGKPSLDTMAVNEGGRLSPDWVEILQGLPIGWTDVPAPGHKVVVEVDEHGKTRFVELRAMRHGKVRTVDRVPLAIREPQPWPGWPAPPGPQHDHEPPRITERKDGRPQRLRCLGNGCVPQQVALVGLVIKALENIRK